MTMIKIPTPEEEEEERKKKEADTFGGCKSLRSLVKLVFVSTPILLFISICSVGFRRTGQLIDNHSDYIWGCLGFHVVWFIAEIVLGCFSED